MKELVNQEVIIVDREEYVKVPNPTVSEEANQSKYLYIPVDEYLLKRETFATPVTRKEEAKTEFSVSSAQPFPSSSEKGDFSVPSSGTTSSDLKKKVVMPYFADQTTKAGDAFGDWVAEKLSKEINRRSQKVLFVDYQMVREFLGERGIVIKDIELPKTLHLLNEVLGIHALIVGQLSGPYVFTTKTAQDRDATASALIKLEMRVVDTLSGKTLNHLSASNPIIASKEKGPFSEEKAKTRAIELTINVISRDLSRELDRLDWFCRVAKVDGNEIYINAGKLTGLKLGDVMEVFWPDGPEKKGKAKGKIQISAFLGIDASMGRLINGKKPDVNDILRLSDSKGT